MSRVAKSPINIPAGVEVKVSGNQVTVKGAKGNLSLDANSAVEVKIDGAVLTVAPRENSKQAWAQAGTARSLINNMIVGVAEGFQRRLLLNGVGYRAKASGNSLNLTLGFSHPVDYTVPAGISIETPSQTEIVLSGSDKQLVGQVAAEIRAFRPPEPYKGKGVRYADEHVRRKEAKKK
ncbi:50S ribosomal protein L6 [Gynuella sunshinyii]|uniref:Large ribosomal subunit protein uL6 n=1 Tax=Gynuella sunshinyii YC6258 TaxID=1445510 RepID=A0A0C5W4N4_9GAMM|nr:50S ribosomal protein L6 [Gynuella sunshinyii]AJQ97574.1 ribosomal protein L6P/L9E [Gynuella sunshinyii YC6258]